jgi:hypothetical protein
MKWRVKINKLNDEGEVVTLGTITGGPGGTRDHEALPGYDLSMMSREITGSTDEALRASLRKLELKYSGSRFWVHVDLLP